ncbi:hypothetical protein M0812_25418 [Anaeramoeba flamelloides]|uniref:Thioredoxin domain-containing protein n=1 Tax=Anaeramoeba flamelloides TaxID=1746091 RepID=A0AAV7YGJ7_9EUKA|nr:hypothetical protein M0812_25418 [Anaeramoeba flamelloides]
MFNLVKSIQTQTTHTNPSMILSRLLSKYVHNIKSPKDFEKYVLKSKVPTIVDFYAKWCAPCKGLMPKLVKHVEKADGKLTMAKIDIDDQGVEQTIVNHRVRSVPSVFAYHNGKIVDQFVGLPANKFITDFVDKLKKLN